MLRRVGLLALGVLLARASGAGAQDRPRLPTVNAGQVATVILQVEAPGDADSAAYRMELADGYRAFVPLEGRVARVDDLFIVPVSFATPERLPAGRTVAGSLEIDIDGYESTRRDLAIRIRERREITFVLDTDEITISPDGAAGVPFRLHNRGNLPDTVFLDIQASDGWAALDRPRVVLAPGDSVASALRIGAPVTASPGDRELVLVTARTVAGEQNRTVNMVVVSPEGWLGGLAQVPSSVFVGQSLDGTADPVVAVSGGGAIGPETHVQIDFRHAEPGIIDPALQRQTAGARLRAAVTRPGLTVEAGDVYGFETTLSGSLRQARGVRSVIDPEGPLSFRAIAALPTSFGGDAVGGHIVHGETELETGFGRVGVLAGDMRQPGRGSLVETRTTGAGLKWGAAHGAHFGTVEATVVRFAADSLERVGPAVDVQYQLMTDRLNGRVRLRRIPDAATSPGGRGNELSASLSAGLAPGLHVVGWGYTTEQNLLGNRAGTSSSGGNIGVRGRLGSLQLQLSGNVSDRATNTATDAFDFARRTVRTEVTYGRGPLAVQADAEVGTSRSLGREGGFQAVGSGVRWYGQGRWGWLRVQHSRRPGAETTSLNAGGTAAVGPVEVSGGLNTTLMGEINTTSFWSATEIEVQRNLSVHIGASARPSLDASEWSFSLGVSRRLNLPLPIARQPDLHGVVFDDANNNGRLDAGEATIEDVPLSLGYLETRSGEDGRFSFRDATGARLQVRTGGLPLGYVLSPRTVLPTRGRAAIPLLRTATLHLDLFLDRDEDGRRDPAESDGSGAVVIITDAQGRQRTATADSTGAVRISGLLPGHYAVTARPGGEARRHAEQPEVLMEIELAPGAEVRHTLAVPLRRRTIRMGGDSAGFQFFDS